MREDKLSEGDIVQLKSGGIKMTVLIVYQKGTSTFIEDYVRVIYEVNGEIKRTELPVVVLKRITCVRN